MTAGHGDTPKSLTRILQPIEIHFESLCFQQFQKQLGVMTEPALASSFFFRSQSYRISWKS